MRDTIRDGFGTETRSLVPRLWLCELEFRVLILADSGALCDGAVTRESLGKRETSAMAPGPHPRTLQKSPRSEYPHPGTFSAGSPLWSVSTTPRSRHRADEVECYKYAGSFLKFAN
ncbi:hypothetical protein GRJ2_001413800 [Grus japonensis]|uniref:Uncharacterized protein n=1 Tax=Grus japonensis TaxID=30415 RepID=A0ABC9WVX6_GRUJA